MPTPGTNGCAVIKGWPPEYSDPALADPQLPPSFSRAETVAAGHAMAALFLADRTFAQRYLEVVKWYKHGKPSMNGQPAVPAGAEYAQSDYKPLIQEAYRVGDYSSFNAHDFANIHHSAWLVLLQAFSCLVAFNPHEGGSWGDPPKSAAGLTCSISPKPNIHTEDYHNIPNATGSYAVNASDITPPNF
ncbi:MAG: hypothetical protein M3N49_00050 [Candidatus Eremiobacteraeota bacterium]|nr:hypothetical protein [Candidatus Eremiobacteraeota bacterium]